MVETRTTIDLKNKPFFLNENQIKWVEETLHEMSQEEKAEQLFCPLLYNSDPAYLRSIIAKYRFGGVMFRSDKALINQQAINALQETATIPLLISANLEDGGNGIAEEGTYMGRQMLVAASGKSEKAYQLGKVCGKEGQAIGVNWAFSPVVDIDMNFRNPITNVRTFGSNPDVVLEMSQAYIKGLEEEGIVPTIKHFPGDGVDERDQHLVTSVNTLTMEEWEETFGKVYRQLIQDGTKTLMVGHIAMPAMEEYISGTRSNEVVPATLSKNIVTGYIRNHLGFQGLISTDASPMVGFTAVSNRKTAVPLAIENGCDVFLFTKDLEEDIQFMKEGIQEGILSEQRLNEAVTRILALKASLGLPDLEKSELMKDESALTILQAEEHVSWSKELADQAITLVKDTQSLLPLRVEKTKKVLLQIIGDFPSNERVYSQFETGLKKEGFQVTKYIPETLETIFENSKVADFKKQFDLVIYIGNIENASNKTTSRINWHTLFGAGNNLPWFAAEVPTLFISVGNPYHLFDVPMIKTFINGYCHSPHVIDGVIDKIMGRSKFQGVSPIDPFCGLWDTRL